jgi:innexin
MQRANEKRYVLRYYQFVPFILLVQALFYLLPRLVWRSLSRHSGMDIGNIMDAVHNLKTVKRFHKQQTIVNYLVSIIHQYIGDPRKRLKKQHSRIHRYIQSIVCCLLDSSNMFNAYLFLLYLLIKSIYLMNTLTQLYAIRILLQDKWTMNETWLSFRQMFSLDILRANPLSKYFPKMSMCDFRIIEPNSDDGHKYTVQCKSTIDRATSIIFDMYRENNDRIRTDFHC